MVSSELTLSCRSFAVVPQDHGLEKTIASILRNHDGATSGDQPTENSGDDTERIQQEDNAEVSSSSAPLRSPPGLTFLLLFDPPSRLFRTIRSSLLQDLPTSSRL